MAWNSLTDGYFKGFRFHCSVPSKIDAHGITSEESTITRRIQEVEYLNFDGAKINDLGEKAVVKKATIVFIGENYSDKFEKFLSLMREGSPGVLVLPTEEKACIAYARSISPSSRVGEGGTKSVTVEWIEDSTEDISTYQAQIPVAEERDIAGKKNLLIEALKGVKNAINADEFIGVVNDFEKGLSTVRRYANTVLDLDAGIRSRIVGLKDNILGTVNLTLSALSVINHSDSNDNSEVFSSKQKSGNSYVVIDEDTGQEVVSADYGDEEDSTEEVRGEDLPSANYDNLRSDAGVQLFAGGVGDSLGSFGEDLSQSTDGNSEEVVDAIKKAVNALKDFASEFNKKKGVAYLVPYEISLIEAMFIHERLLEELDQAYLENLHLEDPFVIPHGEVIYI